MVTVAYVILNSMIMNAESFIWMSVSTYFALTVGNKIQWIKYQLYKDLMPVACKLGVT